MLKGEKILITGPAGQIAAPITKALAPHNEVWGIARFSQPGSREEVESWGVTTRQIELGGDQFGDLPDDFTAVLHLAAYIVPGGDYESAIRVNAEGTGLLMRHCQKASRFMVMTTSSVYSPNPDGMHLYKETDPVGDAALPGMPTYGISKLMEEGVARACARLFGVPTVIARMNSAYGDNGGLPSHHLATLLKGETIRLRSNPNGYSPIHERDIVDQVEGVLAAASVPATIVNWCGDEAVSAQDMIAYMVQLTGREAKIEYYDAPLAQPGVACDASKRIALTGPGKVSWREGIRAMIEARHPEALVG
jgi:nucleoside-diphosphate-sugar epimerase